MDVPRWITAIPDNLKTQEICINPLSLPYVPDHVQTQEMCDAALRESPCKLEFLSDHF